MKFCWTTLQVRSLEDSLHFYQDIVGLNENRRFPAGPGVEIAFLGEGDTQVELICDANRKDYNMGSDISLGFQVDSLDIKIAELNEKGVAILAGPMQPNPHTRFIYVSDPNGLKVQFVEIM